VVISDFAGCLFYKNTEMSFFLKKLHDENLAKQTQSPA